MFEKIDQLKWWQKGIVYQVYPRSFLDSNGDGVGDLRGIEKKLDYLADLGVNAIWVCPFYPSPMKDFGYDISDYCDVDSLFGNIDDFRHLLKSCHNKGLKLIIDLVPNHTSDQHPWFKESRKNINNQKRDWYIWKDPKADGSPPNNWLSVFGGSAWEYDELTSKYYFHQYLSCQPDLNFENPKVLEAILHIMKFWLDEGVDGFRVDVIGRLKIDQQFRDEPTNEFWDGKREYEKLIPIHTYNLPEVHDVIKEFRKLIDGYDDRILVGELNFLSIKDIVRYYGQSADECHMPFNFQLIHHEWNAPALKKTIEEYESSLPKDAWPNWVIGNHDWHRMATRIGNEKYRLGIMLLLTLRGTPTWYYGDELGLKNVEIPKDKIKDPWAKNNPDIADKINRDAARTPMQWDGSVNAGFCPAKVEPWLPFSIDYKKRNVESLTQEDNSVWNFTRTLMHLRNTNVALHAGNYESIDCGDSEILTYKRTMKGEKSFFIILNFSETTKTVPLKLLCPNKLIFKKIVSTGKVMTDEDISKELILNPFEGLVGCHVP